MWYRNLLKMSNEIIILFQFLTPYMLGETQSRNVHMACLFIIIGFSLGSGQTDIRNPLSVDGVFFGIIASFAVALNAILTKTALTKVDNCIWKLTWYNNLLASIIFIPILIFTGEYEKVHAVMPGWNFWKMLLVSGVFGFTMNYVTGWQIKATSPLTHNISANAKSATQTLLAVIVFKEWKSFGWWMSNVVILLGSSFYTWARNQEMRKEEETKKAKTN
uniref:TPT domain-containing protein n=1 Tax=Caenorhabditis tropicalis TaxID=1561998 RepID=A0A1I7U184_9PELO